MVPPTSCCSGLVILESDLVVRLEPVIGFFQVLAEVDGLPLVFDGVDRARPLDYGLFEAEIVFLIHHILREIDPAHFGCGGRFGYLPLRVESHNLLIYATFEDILGDLWHLILVVLWKVLGYVLRGIHHQGRIQVVATGRLLQLL
jgi:hypothetical protein